MNRRARSHNAAIFAHLSKLSRRSSVSTNASYLIFYTFLYKYLSDKLKNYLSYQFAAEGDDLRFFYRTDENRADIREAALNDLGYFIESYGAYIDQFMGNKFAGDFLNPDLLHVLKDSIVFAKNNPCEKYFKIIMETLERQTNFHTFDAEQELLISNCLSLISQLDTKEVEFSFREVYDMMLSLRSIRPAPVPEYITQILEVIVASRKDMADGIYDPFLRDASILFSVSQYFKGSKIYGKENGDLYYIYSLIKAFVHEYDFSEVFLRREDAIESMQYDNELFDVIVSKVPNAFPSSSRRYRKQNLEAPNPNRVDIKEQLISQFDLSAFGDDEELNKALSIVEKKVEAAEKTNVMDFLGEYESLKNSEFLFLINMINCLKEDGIMAVSLSQNFLFKKSLATFRKFLTYENNYIDTIISLPEELGSSVRPEVIIVFRKNKNIGDILFIDLSKEFRAVSSKRAMPGRYRRNLILDDKTLTKVSHVFAKRQSIDKFSEVISISELEKNDFNLTVSRYVDTFDGEFVRLKDLTSTKREIDDNLADLNKKINWMMKDLKL